MDPLQFTDNLFPKRQLSWDRIFYSTVAGLAQQAKHTLEIEGFSNCRKNVKGDEEKIFQALNPEDTVTVTASGFPREIDKKL
jgi:hypothetical protein